MSAPESTTRFSGPIAKLLALGLGVLLLFLVEGVLRIAGFGGNALGEDPFIGFSAVEPLFALNPISNQYDLRPERRIYFVKNGFPRFKKADTFRIFVFGGSTVQGRPYSIETAFPQWLKINLELSLPGKTFEVVNCGGISYASYRLVPLIQECLNYEPDLFILCSGQNEFLEARTYPRLKVLAKPLGKPMKAIRKLATYKALDGLYQKVSRSTREPGAYRKPTLKMEVDAYLDYQRGLSAYRRDHDWREGVIEHFKENVRRIHALCEDADVPLMILNPPFNLKDSPPFKSEPSDDLSPDRIRKIDEIMVRYHELMEQSPTDAARFLTLSSQFLDDANAANHFALGHSYLLIGRVEKAGFHFNRALEEDVCPLRILPEMRQFLERYAAKESIPYRDLQNLLLEHCQSPIMSGEALLDHIHPSIRGHQKIGEALAEQIQFLWLPSSSVSVSDRRRTLAYENQLDSLEELYFAHGKQRLDNLIAWTKGNAEGPPIEAHRPIGSQ